MGRKIRRHPAAALPRKPVANTPERLQIFDVADWLEPGEDAHDDAPAAYQRHLAARRRWYDEHELPPLSEAIATPDERYEPPVRVGRPGG